MLIILILPLSADILIPCLSMPGTSSSCTLLVGHDLRLAVWLSNPLYVFGADLCSDLLQCVFVFIESKDHALHVVAYLGPLFWLIRSSGTSQGTWLAPLDLLAVDLAYGPNLLFVCFRSTDNSKAIDISPEIWIASGTYRLA